jgi:hypothetical protein
MYKNNFLFTYESLNHDSKIDPIMILFFKNNLNIISRNLVQVNYSYVENGFKIHFSREFVENVYTEFLKLQKNSDID